MPFKYKQFIVCQLYLYEAFKNTELLFDGSIFISIKSEGVRNFIKFINIYICA